MVVDTLKPIFYFCIVIIFASLLTLLVSSPLLSINLQTPTIVTAENFGELKSKLNNNSIIKVEGLINSYNLLEEKGTDGKAQHYFAGLDKFSTNLIVKFSPEKLKNNIQSFSGRIVKLSNDNFSLNIINKLNSQINFDENDSMKNNFNDLDKQKISDLTKANYTTDSLLLLDGEFNDTQQIYINIFLVFLSTLVFLLILFRQKIFNTLLKQTYSSLPNNYQG